MVRKRPESYDALLDAHRPPSGGPTRRSIGAIGVPCSMGSTPNIVVQVLDRDYPRPIFRIAAEVDLTTAPELAEGVESVLSHSPVDLVLDLDLGDTAFLDCSGIAVVVGARNRLPKRRSRLSLAPPR